MHNPALGQSKLIASNMVAINAYIRVLQTNIVETLKHAYDKQNTLDRHISLLQSHAARTTERLALIRDQKNDLKSLINQSTSDEKSAKQVLQASYESLEYQ